MSEPSQQGRAASGSPSTVSEAQPPKERAKHVLFGHLLRGSDLAGAARIFARLNAEQVRELVPLLDGAERKVLAGIAFAPERVQASAMLPVATLEMLLVAAGLDEAERRLRAMPEATRRALVAKQPPERRADLEKRLFPEQRGPKTGAHGRVGTALRLRRLFRG